MIFSLPLWGRNYLKLASDFLFPHLLLHSNLNCLRKIGRLKIIVHTDIDSKTQISDIFRKSNLSFDEYEVVLFERKPKVIKLKKYNTKKYSYVSEAQNYTISLGVSEGFEYFVPLYADFIIPDNFISSLCKRFSKNIDYWLTLVPAVETKAAYKYLYQQNLKIGVTTPGNTLVYDMVGECLHPLFFMSIQGYSERFHPIGPYIGFGTKSSFVMKSMHYHPIFIRLKGSETLKFIGTIDEHLVPALKMSEENTHFNDHKELCLASLMDSDFQMPYVNSKEKLDFYSEFLKKSVNLEQTKFLLSNKSFFHFSPEKINYKMSELLDDFVEELECSASQKIHNDKPSIIYKIIFFFLPAILRISIFFPKPVKFFFMSFLPNKMINIITRK